MNFNYPTLETANYNGQRWYKVPTGDYYPSITTVLGHTEPPEVKKALQNWRTSLGASKADELSKRATDHGTAVHLLVERYLKREEVFAPINKAPVTQNDKNAFLALKLKLDKIDEIWGQEVALYSKSLLICGRTDLVGKYKGIPSIVDFKTSGRVKSHADIGAYKLQLLAYGISHNEMFGTTIDRGVILMVAETGFPLEFIVPFTSELEEELRRRAAKFWEEAVNNC